MMDKYSQYLSRSKSKRLPETQVLHKPEQLNPFPKSRPILPNKPTIMTEKPDAKELVGKCTQTCLRRTQPDSPKLKTRATLSPHRLFGLSPSNDLNLPPLPPWLHEIGSKLDLNGACGDHLLHENSLCDKEINADGQKLMADLLQARIDLQAMSPLESAREHCRQTRARYNAKYGGKPAVAEPVKSIQTKNEESPSTGKSRTSVKTTITGKSAEHLRRVVRSQIQMQEEFHQSMNKVTELTDKLVMTTDPQLLLQAPVPDNVSCGTFDLNTGGGEGEDDIMQQEHTLDVKSMMDAQVMAPILRRVQRHYLKNLREEMKIIEDLERAPEQVDKIYKTFKQQLSRSL